MIGFEIAALLCLVFWIGLGLDRSRAWPRDSVLPPPRRHRAIARESIWAVVPARNEEALLARTLPTLLAQVEVDRVVVADDNSEDSTAAVVRRLSENSARGRVLTSVEVPDLPIGWSGKVHALAYATGRLLERGSGREVAYPDWWLFSDADIELDAGTVCSLLIRAESADQGGPFDLVSVMARLHAEGFWERLLVPPFVFFFHLLYPFSRVRDPTSPVAAAAGGCILVRRSVYDSAGGHAGIGDALIDDVELAKRIKGEEGRLWLGLDERVSSIRSHHRLGELWQMVARSAFVQLRYRVDFLMLTLLGLVVLVVAPPVLVAMVGVKVADGSGWSAIALRILAWSSLAWILQARALLPSVRFHRVPVAYCLSLPLAGGLFGLMTLSSALSHFFRKGQNWKGRSYSAPGGRRRV